LAVLYNINAAIRIAIATTGLMIFNQNETDPEVDGRPLKYSIEKNQAMDAIAPTINII
jgi:hypothetical protein